MHVTFIQPAIGRKADGSAYPATWRMQPLGIAMLSALTPSAVSRTFFDDRFDEIDFSAPTDLVAISAECYTAARAYQIAAEYRRRGVKVVVGGFHATLMPDEVAEHADAVCIGEAEAYWDDLLEDVSKGAIKRRYNATIPPNLTNSSPDRVIFGNRRYGPVGMVETSRGCRFSCEFCSITRFYKASYRFRPVEDVVREVASLRTKMFFFTDDNLAMDVERLKELCRAMIPLKIRWASQLSLHAAADEELLELLRRSGCMAVLVGFESLDAGTLSIMDKGVNRNVDYR
ncbi:MAG: B12-binding domain-containing radical SAM protein, partial [Phycisphaerales bacterium]|nr:B12-binding domain-containing radical SAM protein [Phycisphaerales bacterium]